MDIRDIIQTPVLPVIVIDDASNAVPLAEAFLEGGLTTFEITLRTTCALNAIKDIKQHLPEVSIGAGTVLTVDDAKAAIDVGVEYALAPGFDPKIAAIFSEANIPFMPGVMTPSEMNAAAQAGCRAIKFFPAESAGGASALKASLAPFKGYEFSVIPTGGIKLDTMDAYLKIPEVICVGGSWLATRELIADAKWSAITENVRKAFAAAVA